LEENPEKRGSRAGNFFHVELGKFFIIESTVAAFDGVSIRSAFIFSNRYAKLGIVLPRAVAYCRAFPPNPMFSIRSSTNVFKMVAIW
jgi:hypothetical protein